MVKGVGVEGQRVQKGGMLAQLHELLLGRVRPIPGVIRPHEQRAGG